MATQLVCYLASEAERESAGRERGKRAQEESEREERNSRNKGSPRDNILSVCV
jgi:hypothetical protein